MLRVGQRVQGSLEELFSLTNGITGHLFKFGLVHKISVHPLQLEALLAFPGFQMTSETFNKTLIKVLSIEKLSKNGHI